MDDPVGSFYLIDGVVLLVLATTVPVLVKAYLDPQRFPKPWSSRVMMGGLAWLLYAPVSHIISEYVLGVPLSDAPIHAWLSYDLGLRIREGEWGALYRHFAQGNPAYQCLYAPFYALGCSMATPTLINAWLGFFGGLIMVRGLSTVYPFTRPTKAYMLFVVFCPSVIFWATNNLKEGPVFWAICCIMSITFGKTAWYRFGTLARLGIAALLGGALRPHVLVGWIGVTVVIAAFRRGQRVVALLLLITAPLAFFFARENIRSEELSIDAALKTAQKHFGVLHAQREQGSRIEYEEHPPIPIVSGFIAAFFMPFPWQITSLRLFMSALETWGITFLLVRGWLKLLPVQRRALLALPCTQVALLACVWMCGILSFMPNQGLVVRQRVQMIPAILTLAVLPGVLYHHARGIRRIVALHPPSPAP